MKTTDLSFDLVVAGGGLAAAMAARLPVPDVRAVDVSALRAALRDHGAWLP